MGPAALERQVHSLVGLHAVPAGIVVGMIMILSMRVERMGVAAMIMLRGGLGGDGPVHDDLLRIPARRLNEQASPHRRAGPSR
jgi:hypothetical protein